MQFVPGFSSTQTVPAAPAAPATAARKPSLWILDSWRDLILYVCTPLFLVPMFIAAQGLWAAEDIYLFVAAFGAMGHHLPGMIRAYGDRALFDRFRWRFICAPIFLVIVCAAFSLWDLKGIVLVAFVWGVWHGMMQTYGFCRIYDAKVGSFAELTRRLDFALCGIWFATAVLLSPQRMTDTLESYYSAGGPFIPPTLFHGAQQGLLLLALLVSVAFLANYVWAWSSGRRPSPVKLVLLFTSICFWWYCNNIVASVLVGIALFEVFHDVQYLSLVWIYNRKRVESDNSIGGFMRFVFRRSGALVGVYIGLVLAYGGLSLSKSYVGIDAVKRILTGVVTASALLHFYYDGFIWKVREKSTRQSLGIVGGTTDVAAKTSLPSWALHGAKWVAVFVIPLAWLWFTEIHSSRGKLERLGAIVADVPSSPRAHSNYATALQETGRPDEAAGEFSHALRLNPTSAKTHVSLASLLAGQGKLDEAEAHFAKALQVDPNNAEYHSGYAYVLEQLGRDQEAAGECETSIRLAPKSAQAHYSYGAFLEKHQKPEEAIVHYREALRNDAHLLDAHIDLGSALLEKGELAEAKEHLEQASKLDPKLAQPHNYLGKVLMRQGDISQAIAQFEEALRLHPDFPEAEENLRIAKQSGTTNASSP
ncbi:MAG TPA: tetratricopeptide repeat protein [Candidatus Udaeobacter sp.]|jgi:tetratricopeptide (TPR) repeat protein|nr:tetratricopeptide repeat protein [Candidatus Udaeobacter sp.]